MLSVQRKSILYILAASVLWGTTGVFFKELSALGFSPMQVVFLRTSIASLGLGGWLFFRDRELLRVKARDFWCFIGTGLISLLFFNWCLYEAISRNGIAVSAVLLYTAPAFVAMLSAFLFGEKLSPARCGILVVVLIGCAFISGVMGITDVSFDGVLFGLGSGIGYALYSIFGRYALNREYRPQTIAFYTFLLCAAGSGFLSFVFAGAFNDSGSQIPIGNPQMWALAITLGTIGCLFPYWLYTKGLENVTGAQASMTATPEPVVAALLGVAIYHETMSPWQILGAILILGSIILLAKLTTPAKV